MTVTFVGLEQRASLQFPYWFLPTAVTPYKVPFAKPATAAPSIEIIPYISMWIYASKYLISQHAGQKQNPIARSPSVVGSMPIKLAQSNPLQVQWEVVGATLLLHLRIL